MIETDRFHSDYERRLPKMTKKILVFAMIICFISSITVFAQDSPKVKDAINYLMGKAKALGEAKIDSDELFFGKAQPSKDFTLVDDVKTSKGCTATIFIKKGDAFVRISTNVMKDDKRAVGTNLDPAGKAYAALKNGQAFYGVIEVLGKKYDAGYEPIKDAGGNVIGAFYVGFAQ